MKRLFLSFLFLSLAMISVHAQESDSYIRERLNDYFTNYQYPTAKIPSSKLKDVEINYENRTLRIYPSDAFGYQPFTEQTVKNIYKQVENVLPSSMSRYKIQIIADGKSIEDLVPNAYLRKKDKTKLWNQIDYKGEPWVKNTSRPYEATDGLEGRHLVMWQSHGKYYKNETGKWTWQRPHIYCTTEDMYTQSFVVPYIIPMLQNAGAVVFTPRERDTQRNEVIVDNDNMRKQGSIYYEEGRGRYSWKTTQYKGFANLTQKYYDNQNPFTDGTARYVRATKKKKKSVLAEWIPYIPETGKYAVYVSYQSLPNSVPDAKYTVFHKGGATEFTVNQRMGGGTWVYLGTFEFDKGNNDYGMVALSNTSSKKGIITADAVRFGGGMGNIVRGGTTSGLPRYLEGARYTAQWSGMPYNVYGGRHGENDYADDINSRSYMSNYLSGSSPYNPKQKGLGVPFEASVAVHSDAGFSREDELIGTLGIYTTDFNNGKLASGISRYASRDLCDMVMSGVQYDISRLYGKRWARRAMWNRNYSETRLPAMPSMILETMSHQNFADMKLGHDPNFKFNFSRAVYKSILKYVTSQHGDNYCVQPLPVDRFATYFVNNNGRIRLTWHPVYDPLETTAAPKEYIVYTRIGYGGFDNGVKVSSPSLEVDLEPGLVYSFKVTAVNKGGESFPSEILSAYYTPKSTQDVLIVNGFNRLSAPATIETYDSEGFDMDTDPGVPYIASSEYCGRQVAFDRSQIGKETPSGLGYSTGEWEGKIMAGNTFDYPFIHGKAIQAVKRHSFVSCSMQAVLDKQVQLSDYAIVDMIFGVELSPLNTQVQQAIRSYLARGGRLLISGANLSNGMIDSATQAFMQSTLHYIPAGNMHDSYSESIEGTGIRFNIYRQPNEKSYAVPSPSCIAPASGAFAAFAYTDGSQGAGIAYKGSYKTFVLGFPFESVTLSQNRAHIMAGILNFLK